MAGENSPPVSVILAVHNGANCVPTAVRSILNQSYEEFEFVVVDDGSTDETFKMLDSFDDSRLTVIRQENRGQAAALNRGLAEASGEYVARIDADDIADAQRLERQIDLVTANPSLGVVGTGFVRRYENAGKIVETEQVTPPETDGAIRREFPFRNPFAHSTVLFRRDAALEVGGYNESLDSCIDYDLWVRIGESGYRFGAATETLAVIRKHQGSSYQFDRIDRLRYHLQSTRIQFRAASVFGLPPSYRLVPFVMFVWGVLPGAVTDQAKKVLPI